MIKLVKNYLLILTLSAAFAVFCAAQQSTNDTTKHQDIVQQNQVVLSAPIIHTSSFFFKESVLITSKTSNDNIRTLFKDSQDTDSEFQQMVNCQLAVNESGRYLFKNVSKEGAQESSVEAISVLKLPESIIELISLSEPANETYPGDGDITLTNLVKGTADFRDGNWLGYSTEILTLDIELKKKKKISKVTISTMRNQGAWIFVPKEIEILVNGSVVSSLVIDSEIENINELVFLENTFDLKCTNTVQIRIKSLSELPDWHPGKGALPWFFLDEIIVE